MSAEQCRLKAAELIEAAKGLDEARRTGYAELAQSWLDLADAREPNVAGSKDGGGDEPG